jgi:hypothetical protein
VPGVNFFRCVIFFRLRMASSCATVSFDYALSSALGVDLEIHRRTSHSNGTCKLEDLFCALVNQHPVLLIENDLSVSRFFYRSQELNFDRRLSKYSCPEFSQTG